MAPAGRSPGGGDGVHFGGPSLPERSRRGADRGARWSRRRPRAEPAGPGHPARRRTRARSGGRRRRARSGPVPGAGAAAAGTARPAGGPRPGPAAGPGRTPAGGAGPAWWAPTSPDRCRRGRSPPSPGPGTAPRRGRCGTSAGPPAPGRRRRRSGGRRSCRAPVAPGRAGAGRSSAAQPAQGAGPWAPHTGHVVGRNMPEGYGRGATSPHPVWLAGGAGAPAGTRRAWCEAPGCPSPETRCRRSSCSGTRPARG